MIERPTPTPAELEILHVLWRLGPSTVREVHEDMNQTRETGYTTTLKMLQVMKSKGLVTRKGLGKAHIYQPSYTEESTQRGMVDELLERAFGGAAQKLVMQALTSKQATPEDLDAIRLFLDRLDAQAEVV